MKANLTIEIESGLLDAVTRYAKSKGKSVSEVLSTQLRKLAESLSDADSSTPVSSRLRGVVRLPEGFDYKQELERRNQ